MWSSLQQNYEAVFKPLKPLISKELVVFFASRAGVQPRVFRGVHGFMNTGCSGCSGGVHGQGCSFFVSLFSELAVYRFFMIRYNKLRKKKET